MHELNGNVTNPYTSFSSIFVFTVCRTADLYLTSTIGSGMKQKQRPRLNLTVKNELKGLGGRIIAQSGMAKVRRTE